MEKEEKEFEAIESVDFEQTMEKLKELIPKKHLTITEKQFERQKELLAQKYDYTNSWILHPMINEAVILLYARTGRFGSTSVPLTITEKQFERQKELLAQKYPGARLIFESHRIVVEKYLFYTLDADFEKIDKEELKKFKIRHKNKIYIHRAFYGKKYVEMRDRKAKGIKTHEELIHEDESHDNTRHKAEPLPIVKRENKSKKILIGQVSSTGKWKESKKDAKDGSEIPRGVVSEDELKDAIEKGKEFVFGFQIEEVDDESPNSQIAMIPVNLIEMQKKTQKAVESYWDKKLEEAYASLIEPEIKGTPLFGHKRENLFTLEQLKEVAFKAMCQTKPTDKEYFESWFEVNISPKLKQ